jgi:hypothetical protein
MCSCGATVTRLTTADIVNGVVGEPQPTDGDVTCNECNRKRREKEKAEWQLAKARREWASKQPAMKKGPTNAV